MGAKVGFAKEASSERGCMFEDGPTVSYQAQEGRASHVGLFCAGADANASRNGQSRKEIPPFAVDGHHGDLGGRRQEGATGKEAPAEKARSHRGRAVDVSPGR